MARSVGYDVPALYVAYAKAFRKVKDYANEIVIIEEFFERNPKMQHGELAASKEVGVSPKCIRDAAKGIQKHAGRFVWKYKDDLRIDE